MHLLHEVRPRRAARSDQRELAALVDEALDELAGFFDDRDVGGEVGVEHGAEAEAAQRGVNLAREVRARRQAKRLAEGDAHARGDLHHADLVLVMERLPHGGGLVVFDDRAGRAVGGALAAFDTG